MSTKKISKYPIPEIYELPEDVQAIHKGAIESFGFVPNVDIPFLHKELIQIKKNGEILPGKALQS